MQASSSAQPQINDTEDGYADLLSAMAQSIAGPLFTTSAEGLFDVFLSGLPEDRRQHYTCHACRRFVDAYGGLVRISEAGIQEAALWPVDVPVFFHESVALIRRKVERAKVTGVFLSKLETFGVPVTGSWRHLHATNATPFKVRLKDANQVVAERLEEHGMLLRGLAEFSLPVVKQAERLLKSEALYRSEKCLGVATWLRELHRRRYAVDRRAKDNLTWLAVATAPAGFCHVRSTMIGTLLDDIASGVHTYDAIAARFREKMHPLQYQRPNAPPSAGNIARAEKIVAELAAAGALRRRFARLDDVKALWLPQVKIEEAASGTVFGHLKGKRAQPSALVLPTETITWEKFRRVVLSNASEIAFYVPGGMAGFSAFLTACDPEAPPILQWDVAEERNPVSWYFYNGGSPAVQWGLTPGLWANVTAVCLKPSMWGSRPQPNQGEGVFLLLDGAQDSRDAGLALFPEILKSDYHEIRRTIEAYSGAGKLEGREESSACGVGFSKGDRWKDARLRVVDRTGGVANYVIDRWD